MENTAEERSNGRWTKLEH